MPSSHDEADGLALLQAVQARVRKLVKEYPWFVSEIEIAASRYAILCEIYQVKHLANLAKQRRLARELLASGRFTDPTLTGDQSPLTVKFDWLCPVELAAKLKKAGRGTKLPPRLERQAAEAALSALDGFERLQAEDLTDDQSDAIIRDVNQTVAAKTHVEFPWRISIARPEVWEEPPDPHALDLVPLLKIPAQAGIARADHARYLQARFASGSDGEDEEPRHLARFDSASYRAIAVVRLAGLASTPQPDPVAFPPDVAEQMADTIEAWAADEDVYRKRIAELDAKPPLERLFSWLFFLNFQIALATKTHQTKQWPSVSDLCHSYANKVAEALPEVSHLLDDPSKLEIDRRTNTLRAWLSTIQVVTGPYRFLSQPIGPAVSPLPPAWDAAAHGLKELEALLQGLRTAGFAKQTSAVMPQPAPSEATRTSTMVGKNSGSPDVPRPTAQQLCELTKISIDKFRMIRERAGVAPSKIGRGGADRRYSHEEIDALIVAAQDGSFENGWNIANTWRPYGTPKPDLT
jgi:hypothetical protein